MNAARALMLASEILVAVALIARILLPTNLDLGFRVSSETAIGIPIRWFIPLFLISVAGVCSIAALLKMYLALAHRA